MPQSRRRVRARHQSKKTRGVDNALGELRKQAQAVVKRLQRLGRQRISAIEKQIAVLNKQRQALMNELGTVMHGVGKAASRRSGARRGRRARVDWTQIYAKLPRGSFKAADVRRIVPGVAAGTLSQRLTAWVKGKKLRRTGARRGTRYTKV